MATGIKRKQLYVIATDTVLANAAAIPAIPAEIAVAEQTVLGRITGGHIVALTVAQQKTMLAYAIGDLASVAANTVMVNATAGAAVVTAMAVAVSTFVGRIATGNVIAMSVAQAKTLLAYAIGDLAVIATDTVVANNTAGNSVPLAIAMAEQTILGRITGGHIAALTGAQVLALLAIFSGLAKISVGTGTPGAPNAGDLWVDTN